MKNSKYTKAFTLVELVVVVGIIAVLSGIVLVGVSKYIGKGKDSNIYGNLIVLIPAGEKYYDGAGEKYTGFCTSDVATNSFSQMPSGTVRQCNIAADGQSWASCAKEFTDTSKAFCVDSRGMREEILNSACTNQLTQCP